MLRRRLPSVSRAATQRMLHYHNPSLQRRASLHGPRSSSKSLLTPCFCRSKAPSIVPEQAMRCLSHDRVKLEDGTQGNYFDPPFWDSTYASDPQPLEWYQSYAELSLILKKYISSHSRVLMSGCGNSEFSEDMVKDGFEEIVNIDISSVVIEAMQKKYKSVPELKYMTMDVLDMSDFENGFFDCVIDKGTLDAIMCVAGGPYNVAMMLAEITRILKHGGVYMLVSFAGPHVSLPLLNRKAFGWSIDSYVLCKESSLDNARRAYSEPVLINVEGAPTENPAVRHSDSLYIYMCTKLH